MSVFSTSPLWSPAAAGAETCPPPSSSAAGWSGRGWWRSGAGRSFSGAASQTDAGSLGGWSSAAVPKSEAPSPVDTRWASRSAGRGGLGETSDTSVENGAASLEDFIKNCWKLQIWRDSGRLCALYASPAIYTAVSIISVNYWPELYLHQVKA